jgi:hypothetical protein
VPQKIEVPGHGVVEFPDGMSDDEIVKAIKKNMLVPKPASKTKDVGLSILSGAGQGVADIGEAPGTAFTNMFLPPPIRDLAQVGMQKVRGMLPQWEPQSNTARYAGAATRGAVGSAPFGPMGVLSGATGGVGGEAGADLTGDSWWGRLIGSVVGGTAPNVPGIVGGLTARRVRSATEGMTPDQWDAAQQAQQQAAQQGVKVTGPEAVGPLAPDLLAKQWMVEQHPNSAGIMGQFMNERPGQVKGAVKGVLGQIGEPAADPRVLGGQVKQGAEGMLRAAERQRSGQVGALYREADSQVVPRAQIEAIVDDVDAAIRADKTGVLHGPLRELRSMLITREAKPAVPGERVKLRDGLYRMEEGTPAVPREVVTDIENLDRARKFMRDKMELPPFGAQAIPKEASGAVGGVLRNLLEKMEASSPAFAQGRQTFSDLSQPINAQQISLPGALAATDDPVAQFTAMIDPKRSRPEVIAPTMRGLPNDTKTSLVRTGLDNLFDEAMTTKQGSGQQAGGAAFARKVRGTDQIRANSEALLQGLPNGDSVRLGFNKLLDTLELTGNRLPVGSRTAANQLQAEDLTSAGLIRDTISLSPGKWWDRIEQSMSAKKMAKLFTDPESVKKMRQMAVTNPGSAKARALAASILGLNPTELEAAE